MTEQQLLIPLDIGERLAKARRAQRKSLQSCATALRVPKEVLAAIEANQLDGFAPIYRRGHIQSYAKYLGMEQTETNELLGGIGQDEPELKSIFVNAGAVQSSDRWLRFASYVLGSLLIGTLAWQLTHEAVRLLPGDRSDRMTEAATGAATGVELDMPEQHGHVNASLAALENMRLRPAENATEASDPSRAAWSALNQRDDSQDVLPPGHHRLRLETSGDSWIEIIDATGAQLEMDLVRGGSERYYKGEAPFRIQFGRASAVSLFLDGAPVDLSANTADDVLQMTLDNNTPADSTVTVQTQDG